MSSFKQFSEAQTSPSEVGPVKKPKDTPVSDKPATPPKKALAKDLERYGITRVPVDYYHYGAYRYTSLKDAIAEAERAGLHRIPASERAGNVERGEDGQPGTA